MLNIEFSDNYSLVEQQITNVPDILCYVENFVFQAIKRNK